MTEVTDSQSNTVRFSTDFEKTASNFLYYGSCNGEDAYRKHQAFGIHKRTTGAGSEGGVLEFAKAPA